VESFSVHSLAIETHGCAHFFIRQNHFLATRMPKRRDAVLTPSQTSEFDVLFRTESQHGNDDGSCSCKFCTSSLLEVQSKGIGCAGGDLRRTGTGRCFC
jgi:hypothetical protein